MWVIANVHQQASKCVSCAGPLCQYIIHIVNASSAEKIAPPTRLGKMSQKRGGGRVMASQLTCNRMPYETSECLNVTSHTSSSRQQCALCLDRSLRGYRFGAPAWALGRAVWYDESRHITQQRAADNGPVQRPLGRALLGSALQLWRTVSCGHAVTPAAKVCGRSQFPRSRLF